MKQRSNASGDVSQQYGEKQDVGGPRSLSRLLALFQALSGATEGLSLAELSIRLDSPKSSLLNLLRPLVADAYLIHSGGTYRLGPSMFRLASGALDSWYLTRLVHPFMEQLSSQTSETVLLGVMEPRNGSLTYVDIVHSPHPVRYQITIGTVRPLYVNAAGRVMIAYANREWRKEYLSNLEFTAKTAIAVTKASLKRELEQIEAQGVGLSIDSFMVGLSSVAAPLRDAQGRCLGALIVAGPSDRIREALEPLKASVRSWADKASVALAAAEDAKAAAERPVRALRSA